MNYPDSRMRALPLLLALVLAAPATFAADAPKLVPVPDIPPPPGIVDPGLEPQVTITQKGEDKVEEYRVRGRLYMLKVTPPHGRPYYLIDERGDGVFNRHDLLNPTFQVPMWVIMEF
jgi:hypothetical protein